MLVEPAGVELDRLAGFFFSVEGYHLDDGPPVEIVDVGSVELVTGVAP